VWGPGGVIYAQAFLGHPFRVEGVRHFQRYKDFHKVAADEMPYKNTFLIPILNVRKIKVSFRHPRGAISIVRFAPRA
jgi:hypothetical protein